TRNVATAEVQAAFDEAASSAPPPKRPAVATDDDGDGGGTKTPNIADVAQADQIAHTPIARGKRGASIPVMVTVGADVEGVDKVVLIYRPEGSDEFLEKPMTKSGSHYGAEIPASATKGAKVAYYVEARGEDDSVVKAVGTESRPFTVALGKGKPAKCDEDDESCQEGGGGDEDNRPFRKLYFAVMGGSGFGYTTGADELNSSNKVNPPGFAPSSLAQIAPEVGYFFSPALRISVQVRLQLMSGLSQVNLDAVQAMNLEKCGPDHLCPPASGAIAGFVRGAWFFGSGAFRPYVLGAVGGGQIRHVVTFDKKVCGSSGMQSCVGTVLSGPVFLGPGAGFLYSFSDMVGVVVDVGSVLGFPSFTFHVDVNAGL